VLYSTELSDQDLQAVRIILGEDVSVELPQEVSDHDSSVIA
jgi:hypothetical protein